MLLIDESSTQKSLDEVFVAAGSPQGFVGQAFNVFLWAMW